MSDVKAKSMDELIVALRQKREQVKLGGGADRLAKQREQGKMTARERIDAIVDPTSLRGVRSCSHNIGKRNSAWRIKIVRPTAS